MGLTPPFVFPQQPVEEMPQCPQCAPLLWLKWAPCSPLAAPLSPQQHRPLACSRLPGSRPEIRAWQASMARPA